ncbi:F-box/kelch-repeat protein At3g23880-like [Cicer arietinum]|uniref:F-box/kelch-repeat protein At3g23880-like n=1 Tax=Cicer arietinum TaxID=3827 RepID=A0A1S3DZ24_CICAR|nr:F-box/kelch-repeat protein At3g23880-like [Cicer arietinum]
MEPPNYCDVTAVPFPVSRLLENTSITLPYELSKKNCSRVIGSCNGLVCLLGLEYSSTTLSLNIWLRFWNPATRIISEKLGSYNQPRQHYKRLRCTFGYDNSTHTYKVVAFNSREIKVFTLGDNNWRNIQSLPVVPFDNTFIIFSCHLNDGVHLNGTINWLSFQNNVQDSETLEILDYINIEKFVIISLDLATEAYRQIFPPRGFHELVRVVAPTIAVLMDSLYFSYHYEGTHFVTWKMTEFGVEQS